MNAALPSINAALNATAAVLLVWGYILIRSKRIALHRRVMLCAFAASSLFLAFYEVEQQAGSLLLEFGHFLLDSRSRMT